MLSPNLFLRQVEGAINVPKLSVDELSQVKLFPEVEDRWELREKLGEKKHPFDEQVESVEFEHDCFEALEIDADMNGKEIVIRKIIGPEKGIYELRWSPTTRMVIYCPPDDAVIIWDQKVRAVGLRSDASIYEQNDHGEWASAEMHFFIKLDEANQWEEIQIQLETRLFSGSDIETVLDELLFAQAKWTDSASDGDISQNVLTRLSEFCIIPRTASSILELTLPLEEQDVEKVCVLLGLSEEAVRIFRSNWEIAVNRGMEFFVLGQMADVAIESKFTTKIRRSAPEVPKETARWEFDAEMIRKDTGRPAMRHSSSPFTDPNESIVDMKVVEKLIAKLLKSVNRLNDNELWGVADRRLNELYDDLGMLDEE